MKVNIHIFEGSYQRPLDHLLIVVPSPVPQLAISPVCKLSLSVCQASGASNFTPLGTETIIKRFMVL